MCNFSWLCLTVQINSCDWVRPARVVCIVNEAMLSSALYLTRRWLTKLFAVLLCNCMQIALFNFLLISFCLPVRSVIWVTLILLSHAVGYWSSAWCGKGRLELLDTCAAQAHVQKRTHTHTPTHTNTHTPNCHKHTGRGSKLHLRAYTCMKVRHTLTHTRKNTTVKQSAT